jgi:peptide/nickel transport system permease protein
VTTVVFAILHLSPGDPAVAIAGDRASQEFVQEVRSNLGLNDPLWQQYVRFLRDTATLDFGQSYKIQRGTPVTQILGDRLPITIELAILGQIAGLLFGLPLGILSAVKQDTLTDHLTRVGALAGVSIPIYRKSRRMPRGRPEIADFRDHENLRFSYDLTPWMKPTDSDTKRLKTAVRIQSSASCR